MQGFDNDVLLRNISMLIASNNVTQEVLAGKLGMSQPNFNRAIHNTDGKRFTIEQIFDLAHYFGVSIDWLMGNQDEDAITPKSAAKFITSAISSGVAKFTPVTVEETVYRVDEYTYPAEKKEITNQYLAVYFPTYSDLDDGIQPDEDYQVRQDELMAYGNQTPFWALNAYLNKFEGFYKLLKSRSMDEEDFQTLVAKHLEKIEEN
ncbi:MAG: helix-turn-helix domain-containing protein [Clostridia bacterium]|nr:helix-turn-helix domain-containing protein [Clostridia bacterium]